MQWIIQSHSLKNVFEGLNDYKSAFTQIQIQINIINIYINIPTEIIIHWNYSTTVLHYKPLIYTENWK